MGLLVAVVIVAASVQDRDVAGPLLWNLHRSRRRIRLVWADAGYTGGKLAGRLQLLTQSCQALLHELGRIGLDLQGSEMLTSEGSGRERGSWVTVRSRIVCGWFHRECIQWRFRTAQFAGRATRRQ